MLKAGWFYILDLLIAFGSGYDVSGIDGLCNTADFEFHYTECDARGERWRFAVPKSNARHCAANAPPPRPGLNCSFTCPAGHFLDLESQECRQCRPGTYSLGDGMRYEHINAMPPGFTVENFPDESDQYLAENMATENANRAVADCSNRMGWVVQNGELRYLPTPCTSKLSISLNLVHDGYIQFYYKMPRNSRSLLTILKVRNAFCQSYGNTRSMFLHSFDSSSAADISTSPQSNGNISGGGVVGGNGPDFQVKRIPIRAGQNLLTWTVTNNRELTTLADIIHVATIDIVGLAFTPICSVCPEGTFSLLGAQKCTICGAGTFSPASASFCQRCKPAEYSEPKAAKCERRPMCESFDYYMTRDARCINNVTWSSKSARVEPEICAKKPQAYGGSDSSSDSDGNAGVECPPCRAGMQRSLSSGLCKYCGNDEYSLNGRKCLKCLTNTIPKYGLYFNRWDVLPAEVTTSCEYLFAGQAECKFAPMWIPHGNRVESAPTRARGVALSIAIDVGTGFYNPLRTGGMESRATPENPIGQLAVDFEMICIESSCQLYLVQELLNTTNGVANQHFIIIAAFNGTQRRTTLVYPIVENRATRFVLAFMRSRVEVETDEVQDRAVLYSLNITHVGDAKAKRPAGGGAECVPCPARDPITNQCQPCPMGHYLSNQNNCTKCPFGTALNMTSSMKGLESCVQCGANLGSDDGTECTFSGRFELNSTVNDGTWKIVQFDVSRLKDRVLKADGIRVFAREGNSYFHSFNISLFGKPIRCRDTFDSSGVMFTGFVEQASLEQEYEDNALFCRAAAVPSMLPIPPKSDNFTVSKSSKNVEEMSYVSSITIARKIAAVTQNRTFRGFHLSNDQLDYDSALSSTVRPMDVHVFYEPLPTRLPSCPLGTLGVVTLRCELTAADNPILRLSRKCPDGTCDGCLYHVIMETSLACPICHPDDFEEIRGECVDNIQKIHYIPSKHCVLSGAQNHERTEACSVVSDKVFLLLLLAALVIMCLVIVVLIIYEKNKSLEYRYMRIVEGKDMEDLNSCALKSDDEDEGEEAESIANHKDNSKTRVFFQKKKNDYKVTLNKKKNNNSRLGDGETSQFLSESSDDG